MSRFPDIVGIVMQIDVPRDDSLGRCVPLLVSRQAAATPGAPALIDGDRTLTYAELHARAVHLAQHLRTLGVGPEVLVGLCVARSAGMVVGALGILMAGGAYLPLDSTYPPERLGFMLADAQVPVLVSEPGLVDRLPAGAWQTVALDVGEALSHPVPMVALPEDLTPEHLAYVIYTSGSTGRPKGVEVTHRSLLNLVHWHRETFAVTSADRATQLVSPSFDATVWEIWPYLTVGATVYFAGDETRVSAERLRDWMVEQGITISFLPTLLAERAIELAWPAATALRVMLTGADTLHHYPPPGLPFALVNNYGPTEATVVATSGRVLPEAHPSDRPSIGRPIAGVQVYLLDGQMQRVTTGEPGELYIGGAGVARGYLNRPALTAERFISNPFSAVPGDQLYKTGDRAYSLPDGRLAFIGRADDQIKLRGCRIEPGEIVAALNQHAGVQASAVVAREETPGDPRLVAYLVLSAGAEPSAAALREHLATRLPDYMVPSTLVCLPALPLNASGKVDRASLPAPDETNILPASDRDAPRTPLEERVAAILAELLEVERVGVHDNFFLLGGHSLLATQVIMWVNATFGVELPMRVLFDAPTVARLAAEIERRIIACLEPISEDDVQRVLGA
ncbi:MAG: non-ribosomal peptide synthetase [Chloroflexota bacterium]|nr:non-ribosomal peptide synthetase [Chloroflexota bacterium]